MRTFKSTITSIILFIAMPGILFTGCNPLNRTQRGAAIGSGAGITVGALIGRAGGNAAMGAIIGGAVGGTAGAYIGKKMNSQAADIKAGVPDANVKREGEGIVLKFNSGLLFEKGSIDLTDTARSNLHNLAVSLKHNPKTKVTIIGHTDSLGTADYNMGLSEKRAGAVKTFLVADSVSEDRITAIGRGATDPVANNSTAEGRAQNRRVEIVIVAGKKLKKQAREATR